MIEQMCYSNILNGGALRFDPLPDRPLHECIVCTAKLPNKKKPVTGPKKIDRGRSFSLTPPPPPAPTPKNNSKAKRGLETPKKYIYTWYARYSTVVWFSLRPVSSTILEPQSRFGGKPFHFLSSLSQKSERLQPEIFQVYWYATCTVIVLAYESTTISIVRASR